MTETTEVKTESPPEEQPAVVNPSPIPAAEPSPIAVLDVPVPQRKFHSRTDALTVVEGLDLAGQTILITGTTSGIGIETARTLALKGAHVVMANRNIIQSEELRDKIYAEYPEGKPKDNIDLIHMDLSSLQSVQAAAKEFLSKRWPLNVLILNAGVFGPEVKTTIDGYETTFGVNHLGHFYLTYLLLDKLRESAPSRVVVVSSNSHSHTRINPALPLEDVLHTLVPDPAKNEFGIRLYSYSKLCNVLFGLKLHRDEASSGIHTYVLHPGTMIGTNISRNYGVFGRISNVLLKPFTKTLQQGAATSVYCAVSPDVADQSGRYYESCWEEDKDLAAIARDEVLQDALWTKSLELIKKFEDSRQ